MISNENRLAGIAEQFERMLGKDLTVTQRADMENLARAIALPVQDPFWSLIAFFYARSPGNDMLENERFRLTIERLDRFEQSVLTQKDQGGSPEVNLEGLKGALPAILKEALPRQNLSSRDIDPEAIQKLTSALEKSHTEINRHPFKTWLIDRFEGRHAWMGIGSIIIMLGFVGVLSYNFGARQSVDAENARIEAMRPVARWALSDTGQRVYRFVQINASDLKTILGCGWKGAVTRTDGKYTICYPTGQGEGYYIDHGPGLFQKALDGLS